MAKIDRNGPCPCGSGLKSKQCHGDSVKIEYANFIANQTMSVLVAEEQKKRGLMPYRFRCGDCGAGFDAPDVSTVEPIMPICPECNSIKINKDVPPVVET